MHRPTLLTQVGNGAICPLTLTIASGVSSDLGRDSPSARAGIILVDDYSVVLSGDQAFPHEGPLSPFNIGWIPAHAPIVDECHPCVQPHLQRPAGSTLGSIPDYSIGCMPVLDRATPAAVAGEVHPAPSVCALQRNDGTPLISAVERCRIWIAIVLAAFDAGSPFIGNHAGLCFAKNPRTLLRSQRWTLLDSWRFLLNLMMAAGLLLITTGPVRIAALVYGLSKGTSRNEKQQQCSAHSQPTLRGHSSNDLIACAHGDSLKIVTW